MMDAILDTRKDVLKKTKELDAANAKFNKAGIAFSRKVVNLLYDAIQEKTGIDPFFFSMHKQESSDIGSGIYGEEGNQRDYRGQIHFLYSVSLPTFVLAFLDGIEAHEMYTGNKWRKLAHDKALQRDLETLLQLLRKNGYGEEDMSLTEILSGNPRAMAFAAGFDDMRGIVHYNERLVSDAEKRHLEAAEKVCPGFGKDYKLGHFEGCATRGNPMRGPKYRQQFLNFCLVFDPEDEPKDGQENKQCKEFLSFRVNIGSESCPDSAWMSGVPWQFNEFLNEFLSSNASPESVAAKVFDAFRFNESEPQEERRAPGPSM